MKSYTKSTTTKIPAKTATKSPKAAGAAHLSSKAASSPDTGSKPKKRPGANGWK